MMASMMNTSVFYQLPASDTLYHSQYEVKAGRWPRKLQRVRCRAGCGWFHH